MRDLIIAEKQDLTLLGLQYIAQQTLFIKQVLYAKDFKTLQALLFYSPDAIVILDPLAFSELQELKNIQHLSQVNHQASWIMLFSDLSNWTLISGVVKSGSYSVVLKSSSEVHIRKALQQAIERKRFVVELLQDKLTDQGKTHTQAMHLLTASEIDVLREIASGKTTKLIAFEKNLSIHTIVTHRKNIFRKLEINNVHDAIRYAIKAGLTHKDDYSI